MWLGRQWGPVTPDLYKGWGSSQATRDSGASTLVSMSGNKMEIRASQHLLP